MRATSVQVWDKDAGSEDDLMGIAEISKLERFPLWPIRCAAQWHASALSRTAARALQRARARTDIRKCARIRIRMHLESTRTHSCAHGSIAADKCHRRLQDGTFVRNPEIFLSGTRARAHTRVRVRAFTRVLVRAACVSPWHGAGRARSSARR